MFAGIFLLLSMMFAIFAALAVPSSVPLAWALGFCTFLCAYAAFFNAIEGK